MTTRDLLSGYGIIKPDILTFGEDISVLSHLDHETCTSNSGTSFSSPIIAAGAALALSQIKDKQ